MKKSILNLGKALNKAEQKKISGGENLVCCGRCEDGSCNSWATSKRACTFAPIGSCY